MQKDVAQKSYKEYYRFLAKGHWETWQDTDEAGRISQ